jgi:hypothetical protein
MKTRKEAHEALRRRFQEALCFFCAARPLEDILDLAKRHPDRARKCIEMEAECAFGRLLEIGP